MVICSEYTGLEKKEGAFLIHTNGPDILLQFMTPEIFRIRVSFDKVFAEESYVLSTTAWEDRLDFLFEGERTRITPTEPDVLETEKNISFTLQESGLTLSVLKKPFCIRLYDDAGDLLYSDVSGYNFIQDSNNRRFHYSKVSYTDAFYGFGEKAGPLNKSRKYLRMSGKDAMSWDPVHTDPLYKHIPFYIKLMPDTGKAVGMFYHNTYESAFCMNVETSSIERGYTYFQTDGGDIDWFLISGKQMKDILSNYTLLTGRPVMLPKRALGYQGSGMFYSEQPKGCQEAVLGFIDTVRKEGYPIDGFYISSGYTAQQENKRCVFTWNKERYEDPEKLIASLQEAGAPAVPNVKPGVLFSHPLYQEMLEEGVFIRNSDDTDVAVGRWWGGPGVFWDFTNPDARNSWKQRLKETLIHLGIRAIWNDNCEHDGLLDQDSICDFDGKKGTIGQLRPIMPNLMNKIAVEAIAECDPNARPYVLSRGGFSGIQKYAQTWCGDNTTSWDTLRYNIATVLGMGMSGVANNGTDIGGFTGDAPEPELWVRWVQSGIFQPRFCIHSCNSDFTNTEPWMYEETNDIIRTAILLRYRLLPYLYTAEYQAHLTGEPITRPLIYDFQQDPNCCEEDINYMFGRDLLIANVVEKGATVKEVYLPSGTRWYDWETFQGYEGGQVIKIPVTLASIPMFIREGGIVPIAMNQIMNMARDKVTSLRVVMVPDAKRTYELYDDDGVSNDYTRGIWHKTRFEVTGGIVLHIDVEKSGEYPDHIESVQLEIICPKGAPFWVSFNGIRMNRHLSPAGQVSSREGWYYDVRRRAVVIRFENPDGNYHIEASWEANNLLGM